MNLAEGRLSHDVQVAIGALPGVRLFRMQVLTAKNPLTGQVVKAGVAGMADWLVCVGAVCGWLELKAPNGTLNPNQLTFKAAIESNGGIYRVARTVDEARALVTHLQALSNR